MVISLFLVQQANAVELADNKDMFSAFSNYCMGEDAYNAASELVADGWISGEDSDLIEDKEYRELLENYDKNLDYGNGTTQVYTKEYTHGAILLTIDLSTSSCGMIPTYNLSYDDVLKNLADNNIIPMQVYSNRDKQSNAKFYLQGNQVINVIQLDDNNGTLTNVTVSSLNQKLSDSINKRQQEKNKNK